MFSCGPSTNVATYLTIYLGIAPIGHDQKALALFYFYSTPLIPRNNGFRISSGPTASFLMRRKRHGLRLFGSTQRYSGRAPSRARNVDPQSRWHPACLRLRETAASKAPRAPTCAVLGPRRWIALRVWGSSLRKAALPRVTAIMATLRRIARSNSAFAF